MEKTEYIYSPFKVVQILENYLDLAYGNYGKANTLDYPRTRDSYSRAPFENAILFKADMDFAVDKLGIPGQWLCWARNPTKKLNGHRLSAKQEAIVEFIYNSGDWYRNYIVSQLCRILNKGNRNKREKGEEDTVRSSLGDQR